MTLTAAQRVSTQQQVLRRPEAAPPIQLRFDPDVPVAVQNEAWTCSVYAADWCLRALGQPSDDETLEAEMLRRGIVTPEFGLMDARGYGLAAVLRDHLLPSTPVTVTDPVTWNWLLDRAGDGPIALGGRGWNHWCGVRGAVSGELALANSAPGHMGVYQRLNNADIARLGPWSAVLIEAAPLTADPWQYWASDQIAAITGCPAAAVRRNWPLIHVQLQRRSIDQRTVCAAAIATVAIETASTFEPVREAFWTSEEWRRANLRYYPWYGRGFIQLTWDYNYRSYGQAIGVDLVSNPDRALEPGPSAAILAEYFLVRGVAEAAQSHNWYEVRRRVQGADAGLDRLVNIVNRLL